MQSIKSIRTFFGARAVSLLGYCLRNENFDERRASQVYWFRCEVYCLFPCPGVQCGSSVLSLKASLKGIRLVKAASSARLRGFDCFGFDVEGFNGWILPRDSNTTEEERGEIIGLD